MDEMRDEQLKGCLDCENYVTSMEEKRLEEEIARLKKDAWDEVACCMEGPCDRERELMEMLKNVKDEICCCD